MCLIASFAFPVAFFSLHVMSHDHECSFPAMSCFKLTPFQTFTPELMCNHLFLDTFTTSEIHA